MTDLARLRALYHVEVENDGCKECGAYKRWTVVGPEDTAIGMSFEIQEDAEELAEMLNGAVNEGQKALLAALEREAPLETSESDSKGVMQPGMHMRTDSSVLPNSPSDASALTGGAAHPGDQHAACEREAPASNRLRALAQDIEALLESLADQQAMPDDSWRSRWANIQAVLVREPAGVREGSALTCDCGRPLTLCVGCAVEDYQASHPECATCCPGVRAAGPQEQP
jgi:hypothetical protein